MCLMTLQDKPMIAENDIECYKVCDYGPREDIVISPFQQYQYCIGKEYTIDAWPEGCYERVNLFDNTYQIRVHEGFHTYVLKSTAENLNRDISGLLLHCIIPKGSLYFKSSTGLSYVSNRIIIKEICQ